METVVQLWREIAARPDFWGFISIPVVAALVTWGHVWCCIQMVFYPLEFKGIARPWLGWQGIIPRKSRKMANILVDKTISKLGSVSDFISRMEPERIGLHVTKAVSARIEEYVDEIMSERSPVLWENLPRIVKNRVYDHARRHLPDVLDNLVKAMTEQMEELVDIKQMIGNQMETDKALIVRMFQEVGDREFRFIVNISFWIGLGFGVLQMLLWYFLPLHFMLPVYAAILGFATNWLALSMVFRPVNPIRLGPLKIHGLFLRRQDEVAEKFALLTARELLSIRQVMREVLTGSRSDRTRLLIKKHLSPLMDSPVVRTAVQMTMGPQGYLELKSSIAEKTVEMALDPLSEPAFNEERAQALQRLFAERIKRLSSAEFQDLLRPAFQEDEWILLVLGAVTGLVAGYLQLVFGFT